MMSYEKQLLGLNLNKTYKQLTHSPPCDFESVWCAVLLIAKQKGLLQENLGFLVFTKSIFCPRKPYEGLQIRWFTHKKRANACALCANTSDRTKYALYVPRSRFPMVSGRPAEGKCGNFHVVVGWGMGSGWTHVIKQYMMSFISKYSLFAWNR